MWKAEKFQCEITRRYKGKVERSEHTYSIIWHGFECDISFTSGTGIVVPNSYGVGEVRNGSDEKGGFRGFREFPFGFFWPLRLCEGLSTRLKLLPLAASSLTFWQMQRWVREGEKRTRWQKDGRMEMGRVVTGEKPEDVSRWGASRIKGQDVGSSLYVGQGCMKLDGTM